MFNEHQQRLWQRMIEIIDLFIGGKITFNSFVGELEGTLDAAEIKDEELIGQWYDFWLPFEILRSSKEDVCPEEIKKELICMRHFLVNSMQINSSVPMLNR